MAGDRRDTVAAIQALRAFAVLWVVVNHAFPHVLPGGFVGVDVFFVISGFLITSHLVREIGRESFSFVGFYLRRARRLLPAALVALILTAAATLILLPAAWQASTLGGIAAAAVYGVNWWLAANAVDYFADNGITSPVNHFWSLSVEEQFYLVWPAMMVAVLWIAGRQPGQKRERAVAPVTALLVVVAVLSFWATSFEMSRDRAAAYFMTHGRAWEFAVGGLGGLAAPAARAGGGVIRPALFVLGWGVLIGSGWMLSPVSSVPGADVAPVALATVLLLVLGDDHRFVAARRLIAGRPIQWLGDISYSLYLWHWPFLVMAPFVLVAEDLNAPTILAVLALCLALSDLNWRLVENRFRDGPRSRFELQLVIWLCASIGVAGLAFCVAAVHKGRAERVAQELYNLSLSPGPCFGARAAAPGVNCPDSHRLMLEDFALQTWESQKVPVPNGRLCQNEPGDAILAPCDWGAAEGAARRQIALLGDSHVGMWAAAIIPFAEAEGLRLRSYQASSCAATDNATSFVTYLAPDRRAACLEWRQSAAEAIIADPAIDTVVVSGNAHQQSIWTGLGWAEDDGSGFAALWKRLAEAGKRVVVIDDVPMLRRKLPDCLARPHPDNDPCARPAAEVPQTSLARAVALLPHEAVTFVPMRDVFCDTSRCHAVIGGIPAYMDADHISAPMARSLSDRVRAAILP